MKLLHQRNQLNYATPLNCNHQAHLTCKQTKTPKSRKRKEKIELSTFATIHDDQLSPNLAFSINPSPFYQLGFPLFIQSHLHRKLLTPILHHNTFTTLQIFRDRAKVY
jgi:hypothetical protein